MAWTDGVDTMKAAGGSVITQVGILAAEILQTVATAITALDLGGVAPGYIYFENKDTVNTVTVASDGAMANVVAVLKPKETVYMGTNVTAFWGQAANAPANLLVLVAET